jgi:hypothetical protein
VQPTRLVADRAEFIARRINSRDKCCRPMACRAGERDSSPWIADAEADRDAVEKEVSPK